MALDLKRFLARLPLFRGFDQEALLALVGRSDLIQLDSGELLYDQETEPDYLYLIISGRLRAEHYVAGEVELRREIGRGESVGGMSILAGRPHKARVRAIRDTTVLGVPAEAFEALFDSQPAEGRRIVHKWLNRFFESSAERRVRRSMGSTRTIAVVPGHPGAPVEAVARGLAKALAEFNLTLRLDTVRLQLERGPQAPMQALEGGEGLELAYWLNDLEQRYRYLIFQGDQMGSAWSQRCLRQADRVLMVVDDRHPVRPTEMSRLLRQREQQSETEVVIVGRQPGQPMGWRDLSGSHLHHRISQAQHAEYQRLARMLTGRSLGLALGGGGARGFAHIGMIRALRELHLEPDLIIGTSMGGFIGALMATGMTTDDIRAATHDTWVKRKLLNDYTVPRVSLIRAVKARRHMESLFGQTRIEDLTRYYACVSTNLNRARIEVHDHGRLAHWVGTSMTVPGIAPPVVYKGDLLVDGGLLAPVPTDVLAALGRGPVVASDVSSEEVFHGLPDEEGAQPQQVQRGRRGSQDMNIFQILYRTATLSTPDEFRRRLVNADCYLRMPVDGIAMFDWDCFDKAVEDGYQHSLRKLELWLAERGD